MTLLTDDSINRAEHDGHDDEPRVPVVMVVHRGDPEEHKYDGLRTARQHFHRVLDGGVRLVRYIRLDVILHGDAAEGDPTSTRRKREREREVTVKLTSGRCLGDNVTRGVAPSFQSREVRTLGPIDRTRPVS